MLSKDQEYQALDSKLEQPSEAVFGVSSSLINAQDVLSDKNQGTPTQFYGNYSDRMDLFAPAEIVTEYLNSHRAWFTRCAEPMMKVQPLGENGYDVGIGRFGSFGYEVEPKIGLELLPPDEGVYRIRTIPIPGYTPPGYDVDYRASLELVENPKGDFSTDTQEITAVQWELDLTVDIHFPKFIQRLPKSLIQSTGDRLLNQIVRQIARRLTRKVQEDFHTSMGIAFPKKW
jgi:Protein of unknown function (DUF1997)